MTSLSGNRGCCRMPCESCSVQFSVFKRKRSCSECERYYCSACLRRGGGICAACRTLSTRPLVRQAIAHLKVRDLQCFLQRQNVSTRGCVEKDELLSLCVLHVNSDRYRRRSPRNANDSPFSSLKGLTNNINEFITSAFDLNRPQNQPSTNQQSEHRNNCYNSSHAHAAPHVSPERARPTPVSPPFGHHYTEKFNPRPRGEPDIVVEVPPPAASELSHSSSEGARLDTADCFEVEDLDDGSWEVVNKPADPLPNDSEVLLDIPSVHPEPQRMDVSATLAPPTPQRATSALDLRSDTARESRSPSPNTDTASLRDEPLMSTTPFTQNASPQFSSRLTLDEIKQESDLEVLTSKQLKELLARNRVEFKGCIERPELLNRARMLWKEHVKYKDEIDRLPIEECCKICMAAPLECVLLECGHIAACTECAKQLAECPICRQYVVRAVRFFRS